MEQENQRPVILLVRTSHDRVSYSIEPGVSWLVWESMIWRYCQNQLPYSFFREVFGGSISTLTLTTFLQMFLKDKVQAKQRDFEQGRHAFARQDLFLFHHSQAFFQTLSASCTALESSISSLDCSCLSSLYLLFRQWEISRRRIPPRKASP